MDTNALPPNPPPASIAGRFADDLREQFGACVGATPAPARDAPRPRPGDVWLVTGPSGWGKSRWLADWCAAAGVDPAPATTLPGSGAASADALLREASRFGLSEPGLLLRPVATWSAGERFRLRLWNASRGSGPLIADDFGTEVDAFQRRVLALLLRRWADADGQALAPAAIVVAPDAPFERDLAPDISARFTAPGVMAWTRRRRRARSRLAEEITIESGAKRDWAPFTAWHYRGPNLGAVAGVSIARHRAVPEPLGIVVVAYPTFRHRMRKKLLADGGDLNRDVRVIQRIVVDPRVRGLGVARRLVEHAIAQSPAPLIECRTSTGAVAALLASMGFADLGRCGPPKEAARLSAIRGFEADVADPERFRRRMREDAAARVLVRKWWERTRSIRRPGAPRFDRRELEPVRAELARGWNASPSYWLWRRGNG